MVAVTAADAVLSATVVSQLERHVINNVASDVTVLASVLDHHHHRRLITSVKQIDRS